MPLSSKVLALIIKILLIVSMAVLSIVLIVMIAIRIFDQEIKQAIETGSFISYMDKRFGTKITYDNFTYDRNFNNWKINAKKLSITNRHVNISLDSLEASLFFLEEFFNTEKDNNVSIFTVKNVNAKLYTLGTLLLKDNLPKAKQESKIAQEDDALQDSLNLIRSVPYSNDFLNYFGIEVISFALFRSPILINIYNAFITTPNDVLFNTTQITYDSVSNNERKLSFHTKEIIHEDSKYQGVIVHMTQSRSLPIEDIGHWKFYGEINALKTKIPTNFNTLVQVEVKGNIDIDPYQIKAITVDASVKGKTKNEKRFTSKIKAHLLVEKNEPIITLNLSNSRLDKADFGDLFIRLNFPQRTLNASSSDFQLTLLQFLFPSLSSKLKIQKIQGKAITFNIKYNYKDDILENLQIAIPDIELIFDNPIIPKVSNLSIHFLHKKNQQKLLISIPKVDIMLKPHNKDDRITLEELNLEVDFGGDIRNINEISISKGSFLIAQEKVSIRAKYNPKEQKKKNVEFTMQLENSSVSMLQNILSKIPENNFATDWLSNNVLSGEVTKLTFHCKYKLSNLLTQKNSESDVNLSLLLKHITLIPHDNWPTLKLEDINISYKNNSISLNAEKAVAVRSEATLEKIALSIKPDNKNDEKYLTLNGKLKTQHNQAINFVRLSPIPQITNLEEILTALNIKGAITGDLKLKLPLTETTESDSSFNLDLTLNVEGATIEYDGWEIEQARGKIYIDNDSIYTSTMTGLVSDDSPVILRALKPQTPSEKQHILYSINLKKAENFIDFAQGNVMLEGEIKLPNIKVEGEAYKSVFSIRSELQNLTLNLPSVFKKESGEKKLFEANIIQNGTLLDFDITFDKQKIKATYDSKKNLIEPFAIAIGKAKIKKIEKGGYIGIDLPEIDLEEWFALGKYFDEKNDLPMPELVFPSISVKADKVKWRKYIFTDVKLFTQEKKKRWLINFASTESNMKAYYVEDKLLDINIDKLLIPATTNTEKTSTITTVLSPLYNDVKKCFFVDLGSKKYPRIYLNISELIYGESNAIPSTVIAKGSLDNSVLKLDEMQITNPNTILTLSNLIHPLPLSEKIKYKTKTQVDFNLKSKSLQEFLTSLKFDYPNYLAQDVAINGNLNWKGAPWCITKNNVIGNIEAEFGLGAFKGMEPGLGRILSLLNFKILLERLQDSKELRTKKEEFEKQGMSFEKIEFNAGIDNGILDIKRLRVDSSLAVVKLKGTVDSIQNIYDLVANVKPELIPTAVTLTTLFGGPIAGLILAGSSEILRFFNLDDYLLTYNVKIKGDIDNAEFIKEENE